MLTGRWLSLLGMSAILVACHQPPQESKPRAKRDHWVETQSVQRQTLVQQRQRTATLTANRVVELFNREEGQLTQFPLQIGDRVEPGELVAQVDDQLLQAQLRSAQAKLTEAKDARARATSLARRKLISAEEVSSREALYQQALAEVALLNTRLSYTKVTSPIRGVVSERLGELGSFASRYSHLLSIADLSRLKVEVSVSELVIPELAVGDAVKVQIDALPSREFTGQIERIYPELDPATRRGTVEVSLSPVPEGARPGQLARVTLTTKPSERLMVPFAALRIDRRSEYLWLYDANEKKAQRRDVVSGLRADGQVEIVSGLAAGELLITRGFLGLNEGKKVVPVDPNAPVTAQESSR